MPAPSSTPAPSAQAAPRSTATSVASRPALAKSATNSSVLTDWPNSDRSASRKARKVEAASPARAPPRRLATIPVQASVMRQSSAAPQRIAAGLSPNTRMSSASSTIAPGGFWWKLCANGTSPASQRCAI